MAMPSPFQRPTISYRGRRWVGDGKEMGKSWYGDDVNYQPVANCFFGLFFYFVYLQIDNSSKV